MAVSSPDTFRLEDRYTRTRGVVELTGLQALVRLLLDRRRADMASGLDTAGFVSGYPGSPLAGLDRELGRCSGLLDEYAIVHRPGLNEELAATSVAGSQVVGSIAGAHHAGVVGMWYGKAPGADRASDAIKHGNYVGAHPRGGVLMVGGDDPACKSSTLPGITRGVYHEALMPVMCPGSPQEVLDLGRHAIELSRASGLWVGFGVAANVADGFATVDVRGSAQDLPAVELPERAYQHRPSGQLLPPDSLRMERHIHETRLPLARAYGRVHRLNRVVTDSPAAWLGVAAYGHTYHQLLEALRLVGLSEDRRREVGIRLIKIDLPYPMEPADVHVAAAGLQTLLIVEDKRPFVELFVKDALYGRAKAPVVLGKRDAQDQPLLSPAGALDADAVADALRRVIGDRFDLAQRRESIDIRRTLPVLPARQPYFCSGCPHNRGAQVPDGGSAVGAGIGCHAMVAWMPDDHFGRVAGLTQMGGEGAQWLGMAPFTDTDHFVQNVGDGTFFHSAHLAVRAAVAAKAHITFKLLYNDGIAMTGGQSAPGARGVTALARLLLDEGVTKVLVTTDDPPRRYRRRERPPRGVDVWHRDRLAEAHSVLAAEPGVTVLIHDQACAAEQRRLRKRRLAPDPPTRVVINPRVCEGCGDCQRTSNCLSLQTIETEYGPKTTVDQGSCNKDLSCLLGDCPSFVTVDASKPAMRAPVDDPPAVPDPMSTGRAEVRLRLPGIGGTGVVTVSQILGVAALLDGKHVSGLDQTGLAQKGGPVVSDLHITRGAESSTAQAPDGTIDTYLVLDTLVGLTAANLAGCSPGHTIAVVNTAPTDTGSMLHDDTGHPPDDTIRAAIDSYTTPGRNLYLDAGAIAAALFGDRISANLILVGAAYQQGLLSLRAESIERAIELNGTAAATNTAAFRWGRACAADPATVQRMLRPAEPEPPGPPRAAESATRALAPLRLPGDARLATTLARRAADLAAYQNWRYARRYLDQVALIAETDAAHGDGSAELTETVIDNLHKLMAYKDEYEVARLHLDASFRNHLISEVGSTRRLRWHLHPPTLRALGLKRKLRLAPWAAVPSYRILRAMRRLRGTRFDPFGRAQIRRLERHLIVEYIDVLTEIQTALSTARYDDAVTLAGLPDLVRGYEHIKLRSVDNYQEQLRPARARLRVR